MNVRWKAHAQLSAAMMIVGSSVVVGKVLAFRLPVFIATALSLFIAAIILVPLVLVKSKPLQLKKQDYAVLFAQSVFGIVLFRVSLFGGLQYLAAAAASIITSTTPAIIGIVSYVCLKERLGRCKILGIGITVFGAIGMQLLSMHVALDRPRLEFIFMGGILIGGSVIAEALFSVLAKSLSPEIPPLLITGAVTVFGLVLTLPLAIYQGLDFSLRRITPFEWGAILYYGAIVTVLSFMLWFSGLQKVDASIAGNFTSLIPVSSMLLSHYFLAEPIGLAQLIGALCVITGNILSCHGKDDRRCQERN
jgi:drug/metabolite transporter (DMT)-like permease